MKLPYKATKVSEHVYWVGAIDWSLRNFHGYSTERGTSYNAYLIIADKITLIDTVKKPFYDEMMSRISSVVDPQKIKYVVSNHSEMDHSGCLPNILKDLNPEKLFASRMGAKTLKRHFGDNFPVTEVADSEKINIGNMELICTEARMVHWPDSMFTFLEKDKILFTNDAFGMHLASSERFTDECPLETVTHETKKYYANILLPFSANTLKLLDKLEQLNLSIDILATDHGPIWREKIKDVVGWYKQWAEMKPTKKAVVIFDTMWGSTDMMARSITDGITSQGISVRMIPVDGTSRADIATEILDAGALVVGSPTLNSTIFPSLADILTYLKGLKRKNLIGAAFGSYGWSGESVKHLEQYLDDMKVEKVGDGIKVNYVPRDKDLKECFSLGFKIGEALKKLNV